MGCGDDSDENAVSPADSCPRVMAALRFQIGLDLSKPSVIIFYDLSVLLRSYHSQRNSLLETGK